MSQFADGGVFASKPYAASGAYINRMSNYCSDCAYHVRQKTESDACPFNALYWDFLARNRVKLGSNNRLSQVYATWDRLAEVKRQEYRGRAAALLERTAEL
jgi:deoxyribodipyrimidine photolyase-related protein